MSNIVINDLEHNIELDRKSLLELKGGTVFSSIEKTRKKAKKSNASYFAILAYGDGSLKRGPHKEGRGGDYNYHREYIFAFDQGPS